MSTALPVEQRVAILEQQINGDPRLKLPGVLQDLADTKRDVAEIKELLKSIKIGMGVAISLFTLLGGGNLILGIIQFLGLKP